MADHRFGAYIELDGAPVGLFLDGAYPESPGNYAYMPVRAIGHHDMSVAVRSGQPPRCSWTRNGRSVSFDVVSIPRHGILSIGNLAVSDAGVSGGAVPLRGRP